MWPQLLARIIAGTEKGVFKTAEGIGSLFTKQGPANLGKAFANLKRAGIAAGRHGSAQLGNAFRSIGSAGPSGTPPLTFGQSENPAFRVRNKDDRREMLAAGGHKLLGPAFRMRNKDDLRELLKAGGYAAGANPLAASGSPSTVSPARGMAGKLGGLFGGAVGRGASAIGTGLSGLAGMGMSAVNAAGGALTNPFKPVAATLKQLGSTTGPVGQAISLFAKFSMAAVLPGLIAGLVKFSGLIVESNRDLAHWNGQLATSFAKLDIGKMKLEMQQANATSGSASALTDAYMDLLKEFQPLRQDISIAINLLGIFAVKVSKSLLEILALLKDVPGIKDLIKLIEEAEAELRKKQGANGFPGNAALAALAALRGAGPQRPLDQMPAPPPFDGDRDARRRFFRGRRDDA